ncbi:DUF6089 family protein [Fulvivirgaceae bacterium LMO-SS25]
MKKIIYQIGLIYLLLLVVDNSYGQSFYNQGGSYKPKIGGARISTAITAGFGANYYVGDLTDNSFSSGIKISPNFSAGLQQRISDRIHLRAELLWYQIAGADSLSNEFGKVERNLSFRARNLELSFVGIFHFINKSSNAGGRAGFVPFAVFGIGVTTNDPKAELNGDLYSLRPLALEGEQYGKYAFVMPMGGGVRAKINEAFDVSLEGSYRVTFTDYLDDVSKVYVQHNEFPSVALSDRSVTQPKLIGDQRGDPNNMDGYFIMSLKVQYYLPNDLFSSGISLKPRSKGKAQR